MISRQQKLVSDQNGHPVHHSPNISDVRIHLPPPQDRGSGRQELHHEQDQVHPRRGQLQRGGLPHLQGVRHLGDGPGNIRCNGKVHFFTVELLYTLGRPLIRDILVNVFWKIPLVGGPVL